MKIIYSEKTTKNGNIVYIAEFNNVIFYKENEYYRAESYGINKKRIRLHQAVYMYYNNLNEIPSGYVIHHIDENKSNNDISNLMMLSNSNHTKLHTSKMSVETRKKLSNSLMGRVVSEDTRIKISKSKKGKKHTLESKQKISKAGKGRKPWNYGLTGYNIHSEEYKLELSLKMSGEKHPMYGKKHTEESKQKISNSKKGISKNKGECNPMAKKCIVIFNDIKYETGSKIDMVNLFKDKFGIELNRKLMPLNNKQINIQFVQIGNDIIYKK